MGHGLFKLPLKSQVASGLCSRLSEPPFPPYKMGSLGCCKCRHVLVALSLG